VIVSAATTGTTLSIEKIAEEVELLFPTASYAVIFT
jgi:hypothetical protein